MAITTTQEKLTPLDVINYEALVKKDISEVGKLLKASRTIGMFYLDLRGASTKAIFEDMPVIFKTANQFFNLPQDSNEKTESLREGVERGYVYYSESSTKWY